MNIIWFMAFHKTLPIRFDKTDGFIRIYNKTRYLTLFGSEKHDAIYNRIKCLISLKSSTTYVFSHYYAKIKVDSYDSVPKKNVHLIIYNVIML